MSLHRLIITVTGLLAAFCVAGGIVALQSNTLSDTKLELLGATFMTGHVGVAFVGIGLLVMFFVVREVLKNHRITASPGATKEINASNDLPLSLSLRERFNKHNHSTNGSLTCELIELVTWFLKPISDERTWLSWDTGAQPGTPIRWFSEGLSDDPPEKLSKSFGCCARQGASVLTIDGKIPYHDLIRLVEPGLWEILFVGPYGGVNLVKLTASFENSSLMPINIGELLKTAGFTVTVSHGTDDRDTIHNFVSYRADKPGFCPIWIGDSWSLGNGGGLQEFWIVFSDDKEVQLWDVIGKEDHAMYLDLKKQREISHASPIE